ncbi:MAG: hypothetical protein AB4372_22980 [Xenococcus sp. (in: cyanobacteria)]
MRNSNIALFTLSPKVIKLGTRLTTKENPSNNKIKATGNAKLIIAARMSEDRKPGVTFISKSLRERILGKNFAYPYTINGILGFGDYIKES